MLMSILFAYQQAFLQSRDCSWKEAKCQEEELHRQLLQILYLLIEARKER